MDPIAFPCRMFFGRRSSLIAFCFTSFKPSISTRSHHPIRTLSALTVHLPDEEIIRVTRDWFDRIVVGWNLCPFADRPNREGKLKFDVIRGSQEESILGAVLGECITRQDIPGTTLMIAPECCPESFEDYLSFCATLEEDFLPRHGLETDIQIAPFHPLFQFADSTDVDVWTNRSPYPIFHILREEEVEVAVRKLDGDASKVWKRNVRLLKELGEELGGQAELENVVRNQDHKHADAIARALAKHKFQVKEGNSDDNLS